MSALLATTINHEQRLFVLRSGGGVTCLGFDVVFKRLKQYCQLLGWLQPRAADIGSLHQLQDYYLAEQAYSALEPEATLYDPGTDPKVEALLEQYRRTGQVVRLFLGNVLTGRDWLEEHDVVGTISRSMGPIKIPLLIPKNASGGGAILTACIVRIVTDRLTEAYRHPLYETPQFELRPSDLKGYTHEVFVQGTRHARFKTEKSALRWLEFMRGERLRAK